MADIPIEPRYEPSIRSRKLWLYTPKRKYHLFTQGHENIELPGFYNSKSAVWYFVGFILVWLLEAWGWINLYEAASVKNKGSIALLLFLGDCAFVFIAHRLVEPIVKLKNKRFYAGLGNPKSRESLVENFNDQIKKWRFYQMFFIVLIVGLAVLKVYLFYRGLTVSNIFLRNINMFRTMVGVYSAIAFLHIFVTGYAAAEILTRYFFRIDRKAFIKNNTKNERTDYSIEVSTDVQLVEVNIPNRLSLRKVEQGMYELKSWGILQDDDLVTQLVNRQKNDFNRYVVALYGCKLQVEIIHSGSPDKKVGPS